MEQDVIAVRCRTGRRPVARGVGRRVLCEGLAGACLVALASAAPLLAPGATGATASAQSQDRLQNQLLLDQSRRELDDSARQRQLDAARTERQIQDRIEQRALENRLDAERFTPVPAVPTTRRPLAAPTPWPAPTEGRGNVLPSR